MTHTATAIKDNRGTSDFLFVFYNGERLKMKAEDDSVNEWLDDNRDRVRLMHVGETCTMFEKGVILDKFRVTREEFVGALDKI